MNLVYIGLGSNLGDSKAQLTSASKAINELNGCKVVAISQLYGSKPMGPQDQPDYVNAVLALETETAPLTLLDNLQSIELEFGRVRKDERWGPRTLDLDIILFGNDTINNERLTVPHYGMKEREFVLIPLAEITTDLKLPTGESVSKLAEEIDNNGLQVLDKIELTQLLG